MNGIYGIEEAQMKCPFRAQARAITTTQAVGLGYDDYAPSGLQGIVRILVQTGLWPQPVLLGQCPEESEEE